MSGNYAEFNSLVNGNTGDVYDISLISPAMNLSTYTNIKLSFDSMMRGGYGELITVEVSADGGTTWEVVDSITGTDTTNDYQFGTMLYDISSVVAGSATAHIKLRWNAVNSYGWSFDNIVVQQPEGNAPNVAENIAPADGTTDVAVDPSNMSAAFSWDAPSFGDAPTNYEFFLGTEAGNLTNYGDTNGNTFGFNGINYNTTYYWKVVPYNAVGAAVGAVEMSFTTMEAPTVIWSSDFADSAGWIFTDRDEDGINWIIYSGGGAEPYGLTGAFAASQSWAPGGVGALLPDNYLLTPPIAIPSEALGLSYKMKVVSPDATWFAETFTVYVLDAALTDPDEFVAIHSETLTEGGVGTAKVISVEIPASFAGTSVKFAVRHHETYDNNVLYVNDLEISYSSTLSTEDNNIGKMSIYPNSVKEIVTINTNKVINSITIVNQLGQTVKVIQEKEILNNTVNLSNLSSGLYFMSIKVENDSQSFKIIKE